MQIDVSMEDIEFYEPEFRNVRPTDLPLNAENTLASREYQPLFRKYVRSIRGSLKGYHGYVKAIDNGLATVEMEAMQGATVLIPLQDLELCSETTPAASSQRQKTPESDPLSRADLTLVEANDIEQSLDVGKCSTASCISITNNCFKI